MRRIDPLLGLALLALALAGCPKTGGGGGGTSGEDPGGDTAVTFAVTSADFASGAKLPKALTCDGDDQSPALAWTTAAGNTKGFALIADDIDAPGGTFTHWLLFDLPKTTTTLARATTGVGVAGKNDFGNAAYGGPCPPAGKDHRYTFRVYALDVETLGLKQGASRADLEASLEGHVLAKGELMGTYGR
ncbi:MAG: YbhB/YbcL family Raf kinase inhibitor-like protein [Polyangiales bacterium]